MSGLRVFHPCFSLCFPSPSCGSVCESSALCLCLSGARRSWGVGSPSSPPALHRSSDADHAIQPQDLLQEERSGSFLHSLPDHLLPCRAAPSGSLLSPKLCWFNADSNSVCRFFKSCDRLTSSLTCLPSAPSSSSSFLAQRSSAVLKTCKLPGPPACQISTHRFQLPQIKSWKSVVLPGGPAIQETPTVKTPGFSFLPDPS